MVGKIGKNIPTAPSTKKIVPAAMKKHLLIFPNFGPLPFVKDYRSNNLPRVLNMHAESLTWVSLEAETLN